jgi:hypothetical protein
MTGSLSSIYQLSFQVSPIIFVNGIADAVPGGLLPIIAITETLDIAAGVLTGGGVPASLDQFFAQFLPLPGAKMSSNIAGKYTFANQAVAANAIIQQPLPVSLLMISPVRQTGGYFTKLAIFSALQAAIKKHVSLGGLFHVATPALIYQNCILLDITDVTDGEHKQKQSTWQWDFEQPLVTTSQAQVALNSLMSKINSGSPIIGNPAWSGAAATVGTAAAGVQNVIPGTQNLSGAVQQSSPLSNTAAGLGG